MRVPVISITTVVCMSVVACSDGYNVCDLYRGPVEANNIVNSCEVQCPHAIGEADEFDGLCFLNCVQSMTCEE